VFASAGISRPSWGQRIFGYAKTATGIAAAVIAVAAFTAMLSVRGQIQDLQAENTVLHADINDLASTQVELAVVKRDLNEQQQITQEMQTAAESDRDLLVAISSKDTQYAEVVPTDENGSAIGRLVWDPQQNKVWFVAAKLSQPPQGKTYQIWVQNAEGEYTSLGTFRPDSTGFARYERFVASGLEAYETAIITIEQAGGVIERSGAATVFVARLEQLRRQ
jgi:hypothetical protein